MTAKPMTDDDCQSVANNPKFHVAALTQSVR